MVRRCHYASRGYTFCALHCVCISAHVLKRSFANECVAQVAQCAQEKGTPGALSSPRGVGDCAS
eukprot:15468367-Alexandrium_andersonii.AAC.1